MLTLKPISCLAELELIRELYEAAFAPAERRPFETYASLLTKPAFGFELIRLHGEPAGFFSFWHLSGFTFIENFAVSAQQRGQGLGSAALQAFIAGHPERLVLEVEPPEMGALARRRITFYERQGFIIDTRAYVQPPYRPGGSALQLKLMSRPGPLAEFAAIRTALYTQVYGVAADWQPV